MALLVSLAALAEQAAVRSYPVRFIVLWILRLAETVVEDFVFGATGLPPPVIAGNTSVGNTPDDALRLAARLHALAATLRALLTPEWLAAARRLDRRLRQCGVAFGPVVAGAGRPLRGCTLAPNDTS